MRKKQLPLIEEAPLIAVGFVVAAVAAVAATALLGAARGFLRITGLDRPPTARAAH